LGNSSRRGKIRIGDARVFLQLANEGVIDLVELLKNLR
jgi:hypothetical protein